MPTIRTEEFMSGSQIAKVHGLTPAAVRNAATSGRLRVAMRLFGKPLYSRDEVIAWRREVREKQVLAAMKRVEREAKRVEREVKRVESNVSPRVA